MRECRVLLLRLPRDGGIDCYRVDVRLDGVGWDLSQVLSVNTVPSLPLRIDLGLRSAVNSGDCVPVCQCLYNEMADWRNLHSTCCKSGIVVDCSVYVSDLSSLV
jgi:hypothetical protein